MYGADYVSDVTETIAAIEAAGVRLVPSEWSLAVRFGRTSLKETEIFQELAEKQEPLGAEFEAAIGDLSTLYET